MSSVKLISPSNENKGEMNMKSLKVIAVIALLGSAMLISSAAFAGKNSKGRGSEGSPVVYVVSQGMYYDSIVLADLPRKGRFQQLVPIFDDGELVGLETEFGPTDVGYLGGRWWVDVEGDGNMDDDDAYFLCPLLGPGRENP